MKALMNMIQVAQADQDFCRLDILEGVVYSWLYWGWKGYLFETHSQWSHCVVSWIGNHPNMTEKLTGT